MNAEQKLKHIELILDSNYDSDYDQLYDIRSILNMEHE